MSDFEEFVMTKLAAHLSRTYSGLATLCLNLPVPVSLPTGAISNVEAIPAVRRAMEIAEEQPMPEDNQAELHAACAFWLGAMDLFGLLAGHEFHETRAVSAAACLIQAESILLDLAEWLGSLDD